MPAEYFKFVQGVRPEEMLKEFPDLEPLDTRVSSASSNATSNEDDSHIFEGHDEEQIRLMNEACICVDYNDIPYAAGSKKTLHLQTSIDKGLLHRAFSVFLFNSKGELLLQQRASEKITFPDLWTNTCCSHPLAVTSEMGADLESAVKGVKQAAIRKLGHELGIEPEDVPFDSFSFSTRIHYMAPSSDLWGEHEIDYILFCTADPEVKAVPNEVRDWMWVSKDRLYEMFQNSELQFTPWFKLICETYLFDWWGKQPPSDDKISRLG